MQIRDINIQKNRLLLSQNLESLSMFLGYEISKQLDYENREITTQLGVLDVPLIKDKIVIATILRAGLPVQLGLQKIFKESDLAFIAAARSEQKGKGVNIELSYRSGPDLKNKVLIIGDTMLATGHSVVDSYKELIANYGKPTKIFIVSVIASKPGISYVEKHIKNCQIITCALDKDLDDNFYIVPGLGDAGDLLYGEKA
jgi:uracil phosphoribosyltransferase